MESVHARLRLLQVKPPIQWVPGALSQGVKRHHSPPSSDEIKMRGAIPPLSQYAFMA